jgi:phage-related protein
VAYDHMTETQFRELRQWLGSDELKEFRFDERPYKAYWAKVASRPTLDYLCFMETKKDAINAQDKERIYKGEGEIEFIVYDPFGYCNDNSWRINPKNVSNPMEIIPEGINWQQINETYVPFTVVDLNASEWGEASGLKNDLEGYNVFDKPLTPNAGENYKYTAYLYNPGDFEADFQLLIPFDHDEGTSLDGNIEISIVQEEKNQLFNFNLSSLNTSQRVLLDTKKHALMVYSPKKINNEDSYQKSLRYDLVKSTHWPKIPKGESVIKVTSNIEALNLLIKYNYKYY